MPQVEGVIRVQALGREEELSQYGMLHPYGNGDGHNHSDENRVLVPIWT